jgi:hypothetical protein
MSSRYLYTKNGCWDRKLSSLSSKSLIPCQSPSLSLWSTPSAPTTQVQLKKRCACHQVSHSSITKCSSSHVKVTPLCEAQQLHAYTQQSIHLNNHPIISSSSIHRFLPSFRSPLTSNQSSHSNSKNTSNHVLLYEIWLPHESTTTSIKKLPMMFITHSTTWLIIWADQTFGYTTII